MDEGRAIGHARRPDFSGPWTLAWLTRQESSHPIPGLCYASDPYVRVRQWVRKADGGTRIICGPEVERASTVR